MMGTHTESLAEHSSQERQQRENDEPDDDDGELEPGHRAVIRSGPGTGPAA